MVRLERDGLVAPDDWKAEVARKIPNWRLFQQKAKAFERLSLNGPLRRAGFKAYAAHGSMAFACEFVPVWRTVKAVKLAFTRMSRGHCAYCQKEVGDEKSPGEIEHFKPKSLFPSLAYSWENYFLSCSRCNLAKLDKWPENAGYVRPDEGDPAKRFRFDKKGRMKAVRGDEDAKATIRDFGLNRNGLKKLRRAAIRQILKTLRPILTMDGLTEAQRRELARPYVVRRLSRFSEAINQNVRGAWEKSLPEIDVFPHGFR